VVLADQLNPPRADEATDALFAATYEEGKNVSEDAVLQEVSAWKPNHDSEVVQEVVLDIVSIALAIRIYCYKGFIHRWLTSSPITPPSGKWGNQAY